MLPQCFCKTVQCFNASLCLFFHLQHSNICKRLPPGSEASNVLVGEVDFLSHPIIAFVRLAQGQYLGDLTEVPIPTRFLFIMLGPKGNQSRYHEIGRSIATLMSDEVRGLVGQQLLSIVYMYTNSLCVW